MQPMLEIHYDTGRIRRIPESAYLAEGSAIVSTIDIGFDDLSNGLILYYRHYEPQVPAQNQLDQNRDPRGHQGLLYNDGFICLANSDELAHVVRVFYEGSMILAKLKPDAELINLHKVNQAINLYLEEGGKSNIRLTVAELYRTMYGLMLSDESTTEDNAEAIQSIAKTLGVTEAVIMECIEFQEAYALGNPDYAKQHRLPYMDSETGELVDNLALPFPTASQSTPSHQDSDNVQDPAMAANASDSSDGATRQPGRSGLVESFAQQQPHGMQSTPNEISYTAAMHDFSS